MLKGIQYELDSFLGMLAPPWLQFDGSTAESQNQLPQATVMKHRVMELQLAWPSSRAKIRANRKRAKNVTNLRTLLLQADWVVVARRKHRCQSSVMQAQERAKVATALVPAMLEGTDRLVNYSLLTFSYHHPHMGSSLAAEVNMRSYNFGSRTTWGFANG